MLLIYTHKITPRVTYITRQIFSHILGVEIGYTTQVEDFIKHKGPKITYTRQPLQNEFFIQSSDLLFQKGIEEIDIQLEAWDELPCFFSSGPRSTIPFDILAASFYLLSRYEEYLPHVRDQHGRFPPSESLAFQKNFLRLPLVDLWANKLLEKLRERFPEILTDRKPYRFTPIIDVTTSHCYAHRGVFRGMAGLLLDVSRLKLKRIWERLRVSVNPALDPYDNFDRLLALDQEYGARTMFFFQFAEYSTYDKNVSPNNNAFKYLIKSVADYCTVSLGVSYAAAEEPDTLRDEKRRLSDVIHRPVNYARMRYNRVEVPNTYRSLVDAEFSRDYSLGYTHEIGFRASTCFPFFFYDISLEAQQPIKIYPFAFHDYALTRYSSVQEILKDLDTLFEKVKSVNGRMIAVFSNELLGGDQPIDWLKLYEKVLKRFHA
ncbi:polysaccharide deacetylase family protein [Robiginitalea aurantiaca]|uniref:Polysaccharide deacetylase family protein n=1 Tax=Robiginitalea aurantiaca TaxID=3056915 RepID=A0ABT7WHH8_9FLAO|nr:polysaccharide deacetylase family protein [Robiginitalea aurantiaca]MDM9632318.1 polysaccharide deacetylase family protein [Robiginitalea aurantiaca]